MDSHVEKVYVVLGNDLQDGFKTLDWTLKKWKPNPISIVILNVTCSISMDFVYTPFGKLPASSVSEEKVQVLRKYEKEKIDKLLSKYMAFCGKVKAEIMEVEKSDEPIHKVIVDLISRHKITKLVMGLTFLKSTPWRSKNAISGSYYIHQHKPNFCDFFIICGGKLVFLKEENEEAIMEDDQGLTIARKGNKKSWLGKMFTEHNSLGRSSNRLSTSSKGLDLLDSQNQWENCFPEIQNYYERLLSLNLDEEICEEENDILQAGSLEGAVPESADSTLTVASKMENMRSRIGDTRKIMRLKNEEAKANAERSAKAEWAMSLCNSRVEELEVKIREEVANRRELKKRLDIEKEQIQEIMSDIAENKSRLNSLVELQSELSNKLQLSTLARSHGETQLEKAVIARAEMVREIEELRRQRDVLQRRIEFCKEKDAIGMASKFNELTCGHREYTAEDIRFATDNFSESLRLKSGGGWSNVYRGRIHNSIVAIKMLNSDNGLSQEDFIAKVKALSNIRHPHLVGIVGFCSEQKCIIFEYMHNGSLREKLFSSHRKRNWALKWHDRLRITHEVCSGLSYLHLAEPRPIIHGHLTTSNIFLDRNLVAKINGVGMNPSYDEGDFGSDIRAFGVVLLNLLTGRNWAGLVKESKQMDRTALVGVLDEMAGNWPSELAEELVRIAMKCVYHGPDTYISLAQVMEELDGVKKKTGEIVAKGGCEAVDEQQHSSEVPGIFLCPIFQDVMRNPHVAADGFSYELEAIEEWLKMGRETSPMTNLKLKHTFLTPNHTLRSLIQEWHNKKSTCSA